MPYLLTILLPHAEICEMTTWLKTSRNTKISIGKDRFGNKVLYKKSSLNSANFSEVLRIQGIFSEILQADANLKTPSLYPELCTGEIYAYQYVEYPTLHQCMKNISNPQDMLKLCYTLFCVLSKVHNFTTGKNQNPIALEDFGPKNLLSNGEEHYLIDLPDTLRRRPAYLDFAVLWFEIDRSLIQTKNIVNLPNVFLAKIRLIQKYNIRLRNLVTGLKLHCLDVCSRYLNYKKNENMFVLICKSICFIPCIFIYFLITMTFLCLCWRLGIGK